MRGRFFGITRLALAAVPLLACLASAAAEGSSVDILKAFVQATRSASGSFEQTVVSRPGGRTQQASGTLAFERPGRFRWAYDKPYYQLIVGDGERLWIYDRDLNQVTTRKLGTAIGASPAALLAGEDDLERNFTLRDAGASDGLAWVEALPRSPESGFERVRIGFAGNELRRMELKDSLGQTTSLVFGALARNPKLEADLFRFTPPKGADVVGD